MYAVNIARKRKHYVRQVYHRHAAVYLIIDCRLIM